MFGGGSSLQLFKISGIRVGRSSVVVLHPVPVDLVAAGLLRVAIIQSGQGFIAAVIAAFLFFGSIVLHELGHAFAARREGIGVGGIDLFFFGGFMRAMRDSETPGEEFRVAAAGPAVTLALTVIFGAIGFALLGDAFGDAATFQIASGSMLEVIVAFTALANAALFILNMVPAFPLDGGRIARVGRLAASAATATRRPSSPPTWARASPG